jgi:hypothetical protein
MEWKSQRRQRMKERLYRFFVRDDAEYDTMVQQY